MNKNSGIYKITNPKNKVYIGQTVNFYKRIDFYKNCRCKYQKKLYNSIKKYGWENHKFEIIEECSVNILNERERFWQEHYDVLNQGLNLRLTKTNDKSGYCSQETKNKIKNKLKGRFTRNFILSNESKLKLANKMSKYSEKEKIDIWNKIQNNYSLIDIQKEYPNFTYNMYNSVINGRSWNIITGLKKYVKGDNSRKNINRSKKIICTETNVVYNNAKEAYLILYENKFSYSYFKCMLSGHNKNITTLKYIIY